MNEWIWIWIFNETKGLALFMSSAKSMTGKGTLSPRLQVTTICQKYYQLIRIKIKEKSKRDKTQRKYESRSVEC